MINNQKHLETVAKKNVKIPGKSKNYMKNPNNLVSTKIQPKCYYHVYLLKLKRKCHLPPEKTQRLALVLHSLQRNYICTLPTMVQFFNCWV